MGDENINENGELALGLLKLTVEFWPKYEPRSHEKRHVVAEQLVELSLRGFRGAPDVPLSERAIFGSNFARSLYRALIDTAGNQELLDSAGALMVRRFKRAAREHEAQLDLFGASK